MSYILHYVEIAGDEEYIIIVYDNDELTIHESRLAGYQFVGSIEVEDIQGALPHGDCLFPHSQKRR